VALLFGQDCQEMNKRKQTVLFITHYPGMYGANLSLCRLMVELRTTHGIIPIVLLSSRGEICEFLEKNEIQYYVSHFYWWVNADKGVFQQVLNYRKQVRNRLGVSKMVHLIANEKLDLVYSNSITINIGVLLSRKLKCPHIWHIRETLQAYGLKFSAGSFFAKKMLEHGADRYIVISDFLLNNYKGVLPQNRVTRIYNGLSLDVESKSLKSQTTILNIAIVGILSEQKNQMDALHALAILKTSGIHTIKLHFIGGNKEDYFHKIKKYIVENGLKDNVVFHGHQSQVHEILNSMDIGLVCARDEAFGRVSIEYMLHEIPVIVSKSGANEELVQDGQNGLLYELYNAIELAQKIEYFIENPLQRATMGVFAKEYAERNFSSGQNTESIYAIIEELVSSY